MGESTALSNSVTPTIGDEAQQPLLKRTQPKRLLVLGVSGGIASGKSSACKMLVGELNCTYHIDADSIAHGVYRPGSQAVQDVVREFGPDILLPESGEIDRKKLGAIVFSDRLAMKRLEAIVWPHVKAQVLEKIQCAQTEWDADGLEKIVHQLPIVVVEAAVLLDAGWQDSFLDGVWVVSVSKQCAMDRLIQNRGLSHEESEKRIMAQSSRRGIGNLDEEVQNRVVTAVIDNSGSLDDLKRALSEKLKDMACWYSKAVEVLETHIL